MQSLTPCVFQKTDVRVSRGTEAGDAQISARGGMAGVVVAGDCATFCCAGTAICCNVGAGGGVPTWYPRHVHRLSKKDGETIAERKLLAHGRDSHIWAIKPFGSVLPNVSE